MSNEIRVLLSALDPHRRDLCAAVLVLCAPEFEAPAPPTQVFLSSLYQKLCGRMFPDGLPEIPALTADEEGYLAALESALQNPADSFDPCLDLLPLPEDSIPGSRVEGQYRLFTDTVRQDHLMAVMRLGMEATPFDPASHTIGVHNVALHTAILAKRAGFPVDLPLVRAAALGHDIGKFGCRGEDLGRIAYLHYYYTWQWFSRNRMEEIGYISANHSTWDLEFENLPIESLLLIYADFRVRGTRQPGEKEVMRIHTLAEAYEMIFCKLADMTQEKTLRYRNVYHKLTDFENLLLSRGVSPRLEDDELLPHETKDPSLMDAPQALRALRDLTLDGSIRLMHTLSTDQTLEQLLEQAKGEKNLQRIRMYLRLLEEYSTYMTRANKRKTLVLLYELLMHPDGDVRRIAGRIMGKILANAGPRYRKERPLSAKDGQMPPAVMSLLAESGELWAEYIGLCLHPDYKISSKHALRISNSLKTICQSLFAACDERRPGRSSGRCSRRWRRPGRRTGSCWSTRCAMCRAGICRRRSCRSSYISSRPCPARAIRSSTLSCCMSFCGWRTRSPRCRRRSGRPCGATARSGRIIWPTTGCARACSARCSRSRTRRRSPAST